MHEKLFLILMRLRIFSELAKDVIKDGFPTLLVTTPSVQEFEVGRDWVTVSPDTDGGTTRLYVARLPHGELFGTARTRAQTSTRRR